MKMKNGYVVLIGIIIINLYFLHTFFSRPEIQFWSVGDSSELLDK